ncbi:Multiubiquitin [Lentzea albidocapillata subsp. violacea]|uniref:Multiubiquitin n=1 Tax=Lentzea albidocapillata subsp. violacea TaxID=128104 RepID=A0A1G9XWG4_9PSEU|nr:multiubiquitin domain-containing protein [Lentzea albidocapillata]SDN01117.1 Multiubiquitin [Lentzea albidocapillata subsp. violacea]
MTADAVAEKDTKHYEVVVNGRTKTVTTDELTFDEVMGLAYDPVPSGPNWVFTVTYRRGHGNKPEGTLAPGESVKVKKGMIFNVTATDKS